jgi:hypothetical protein
MPVENTSHMEIREMLGQLKLDQGISFLLHLATELMSG